MENFIDKNIEKILNIIINISHPDKVILFGSHARGDANKDSDYDFMIIKKDLENERKITTKIYKAFLENHIKVPVDIIACSFDKWKKNLWKNYMIYHKVNKEGIILYG